MNQEIFDDVAVEVFNQMKISTVLFEKVLLVENPSLNHESSLPITINEDNGGNDVNHLFEGFDNPSLSQKSSLPITINEDNGGNDVNHLFEGFDKKLLLVENPSLNQENSLPITINEDNGGNDFNHLFEDFDNFAIEPTLKFVFNLI